MISISVPVDEAYSVWADTSSALAASNATLAASRRSSAVVVSSARVSDEQAIPAARAMIADLFNKVVFILVSVSFCYDAECPVFEAWQQRECLSLLGVNPEEDETQQ